MELTAIIREEEGIYWADVEELPGCFASGHTLDELREALEEAVLMCLPRGKGSAAGPPAAPEARSLHIDRMLVLVS